MDKIELTVKGLSYSQGKSGAYALILASTEEEPRKLPIIIGGAEAQSIAIAMEKNVTAPRPLTHDVWQGTLKALNATVVEVFIHRMVNGVFYASLYMLNEKGDELVFDCRPSDAVAMAVRYEASIYVAASILNEAGITASEEAKADELDEEEDAAQEPQASNKPAQLSREELERALQDAVDNEDYELAAQIRDQLNKL